MDCVGAMGAFVRCCLDGGTMGARFRFFDILGRRERARRRVWVLVPWGTVNRGDRNTVRDAILRPPKGFGDYTTWRLQGKGTG